MMHSLLPSGQRLPLILIILLISLAFVCFAGGAAALLIGNYGLLTPENMANQLQQTPIWLLIFFLLLILPAATLCGVLFLIWGYRLCARLRGLNRSFPLTTDRPILLVLSFFAPVVRLWHPMHCFKRAALLQQDADRPCGGNTPFTLYYWGFSYALFILSPSIFLPILFKLLPCTTSGGTLYFVHTLFYSPEQFACHWLLPLLPKLSAGSTEALGLFIWSNLALASGLLVLQFKGAIGCCPTLPLARTRRNRSLDAQTPILSHSGK